MTIPAGPAFVAEHLKRLQAAASSRTSCWATTGQLETVERLIRRGVYTGPLVLNWVDWRRWPTAPTPTT
jgi:hypothetical protein